jgi:hypothetical protein
MAATASIDAIEWLRKQIEDAAPDPLKVMLLEMVNLLMNAEVDAVCGAGYGERSGERVNSRNGYRTRPWDTRVGTIDLQLPKLRHGTYFPGWLLEPRRRAEKALTAVVAEAYLLGVSTRKVEDLVQALGIEKLSKSQVSQLAKELDGVVRSFRERPLTGAFTYLWLDALVLKCREGGRIVNVACLVAVGVNDDGRREILGLDVVTAGDGAGWLAFLRSTGFSARSSTPRSRLACAGASTLASVTPTVSASALSACATQPRRAPPLPDQHPAREAQRRGHRPDLRRAVGHRTVLPRAQAPLPRRRHALRQAPHRRGARLGRAHHLHREPRTARGAAAQARPTRRPRPRGALGRPVRRGRRRPPPARSRRAWSPARSRPRFFTRPSIPTPAARSSCAASSRAASSSTASRWVGLMVERALTDHGCGRVQPGPSAHLVTLRSSSASPADCSPNSEGQRQRALGPGAVGVRATVGQSPPGRSSHGIP